MKILILTPYVLFEDIPNFTKNRTGFAIMMNDIATSLSKKHVSVGILTQSSITKGHSVGNIQLLRKTWIDILKTIKPEYILLATKLVLKRHSSFRDITRNIFYCISGGYIEKAIHVWKPDIIHIHSLTAETLPFLYISTKLNIPFLVTTHAIMPNKICYSDNKFSLKIEKNFYKLAEKNKIQVTTVSTGMKNRIIKKYNLEVGNNIHVITNGTNNKASKSLNIDIRDKYNISPKDKIILCIGTIGIRKNQLQVLRAFDLLEISLKNDLKLLFIGNDTLDGELMKQIEKRGLVDNVKYCGFVEREELKNYYSQADYNVLASIDEGFGLSTIEAFCYGLPTLTFADLDAVKDLYHQDCMITVNCRNDEALTKGLVKLINRVWDDKFIRYHSEKFSLSAMADKYMELYNNISKSKISKDDFYNLLED